VIELTWRPFQIYIPSFLEWLKANFPEKEDGLACNEINCQVIFKESNPETAEDIILIEDYWASLTEEGEAAKFQSSPDYALLIKKKVIAAMNFGKLLIADFATRNILSSLTQEQLMALSEDPQLLLIQSLLLNGSLHLALSKIQALTPNEIITQEIIDEYSQKLRTYLGI
jgi:hypothetical protein